jgi:competence protein ComGC
MKIYPVGCRKSPVHEKFTLIELLVVIAIITTTPSSIS